MNVYQEDEHGTRDAAPLVLFYHFSKMHATPHGCNRVWNRLEDNEDAKRSEKASILCLCLCNTSNIFLESIFQPCSLLPDKIKSLKLVETSLEVS